MQERIRSALLVDSGDLSPIVPSTASSAPRPSVGDDVPIMLSSSQRSVSSSSLFKESTSAPEEINGVHKDSSEVAIAVELEAAKSLLEMYKQRSGGLVHAIEDMRNQLMALQIENATLKIENEELKKANESLTKANHAQTQSTEVSGLASQAEQNPTDQFR